MKTKKNISKGRINCRLQKKETDPAISGFTYVLKEKPWKRNPITVHLKTILREDY